MPTKAFEQFKKTIQRSEGLINFYIRNKNMKGISFPKDIVRGAVVLSVAAFDAYVSNVFTEMFIPYVKVHTLDELLKLLKNIGIDKKKVFTMLDQEDRFEKIRTLIDNYYMKQTTQRFKTINRMFLQFGIKDIVHQTSVMAMAKGTKKSIDVLIERRHQIAHNGDYNKIGKIVDIDENLIKKRIKQLDIFVESLDKIIEKRVL